MKRKAAAVGAIAIGVALLIIFTLGVTGVFPQVNTPYALMATVFGSIAFLGGGIALAGVKRRDPYSELAESIRMLSERMSYISSAAGIIRAIGQATGAL